jgi:anaerobic magnesium-protoporphyrin IX monomethyl ester cyclase
MKILLIDPPFGTEEIGGKRHSFAGVLNVIPSLGLGYLAAVLEREGHDVRIRDGVSAAGWDDLAREAGTFGPDIVGISATTPTFKNAVKVASLLRVALPKAVFIAGGAHPAAAAEHAASTGAFDYLVIGEGEETLVELARYLDGKGAGRPADIPGLAFRRENRIIFTQPRKRINDLDSLPLPARHLFPGLARYCPTPASYRRLPLAHIITSRGCPYRCTFCDRSLFGDVYRERSAGSVLREVEEVVGRYGAREIRFFDDCLTVNKARLEAICRGLKKIKRIPWTCLASVHSVDQDMLHMMRDAGCWQILYGLESGDDGILRRLGKGTTVERNRQAVTWARKAHIRVRADFIVGTPRETIETLERTLAFAKELPIDFAHFNKFVPFPGTELYRELSDEGFTFDFSAPSSTLDHDALVYVPRAVPPDRYRDFLDRAYKEFYFRGGYILRRLGAIRTFTELLGNAKGFLSVLSL